MIDVDEYLQNLKRSGMTVSVAHEDYEYIITAASFKESGIDVYVGRGGTMLDAAESLLKDWEK
jgi:hypothetical protein